ncbi:threonyl and alanyl trna synthetase second additional domain-containing protein [Stylonychia lemnae]|uniref:Threonyl and alanyl trna synthetase second additional domain-containing protein n=1 Tax=Stylonychia lemnae TaxID=5949 RepID=A0A078ALJ9_STYLE|nr:threonyl and alanyl trna synthetase second additional domain-containing protein [Stylonychia lemnae]|eukprot:CDW81733.1 threonyl and alanyl trna synthetase second additional domain-containing protein [Stylonychia lemnae]
MESTAQQQTEEIKTEETKQVTEKLQYKTTRDYFEDSYKFVSKGTLLDLWLTDKGDEHVLVLDRTIFHPQGGGQPSDEGFITSVDGKVKFIIKNLQHKDDAILHIGTYEQDGEVFERGQELLLNVDELKRRAYARYHSAGHLLDVAMQRAGQTQLKPGKGYHFTSGAYVEYIGNVDNSVKDKLVKELTIVANQIIQEQQGVEKGVWSKNCTYEEAGEALKEGVPSYIPKGQDLRVIKLTDEDSGCPCGGTHVKHVTDIVEIEITKIIKKGKNTRVSYTLKDKSS